MKILLMLIMTFGFLISCQDYITSKRDGLKPYDYEEETLEAEEE